MRYFPLAARFLFFLCLCAGLLAGCDTQDPAPKSDNKLRATDFGGRVSKIETLGRYSLAEAVSFLQPAGFPGKVETTCGFALYRVTYKTRYDGRDLWVSGLLGVPDSKTVKGVVSYQHGTNPDRNEAPSKPTPSEGVAIAALFAGNGYVTLAPDYIGLGLSREVPTYLHTASTVSTVVDFISVGASVLNQVAAGQPKNLYLVGFSQGGSATAGVQRALERSNPTGLALRAAAAVAGAFNLKDISLNYAVRNNSVLYLGYVANAYARIYQQDLSTLIRSEYVGVMPRLFDGSQTIDAIEAALPKEARQLYTPEALDALATGRPNWFATALGQNETYNWKPVAKLRLFYGTADTDVSPEDAMEAYNRMKSLGGNVELVNTGGNDHTQTLLAALPQIQQWFNAEQ